MDQTNFEIQEDIIHHAASNASNPRSRNISTSSWPMFRINSPWDASNAESEKIYSEEISKYAEKIQEEKIRRQIILDQNIPLEGPYSNAKAKCLKICHKPQDNNGLYAVRFNDNASFIVSAYEDGSVEVINLEKETTVLAKPACKSSFGPSSIKFHPVKKDTYYLSCASGNVFMGECKDDQTEKFTITKIIKEGKNQIYAMDITTTGEKMITGGKDARIRIYDLETNNIIDCYRGFAMDCWADTYKRLLVEDEEEGHYLNIYSVVCHPDNPFIFASAGLDSNIKIWDLRTKKFAVKSISGPLILGDAIDLQENKVLSGQWASEDGIQLWDAGSCRLLKTFRAVNTCPQSYGQYFYCAKFMKGMEGFASGDVVLAGGAGLGGLLVASLKEDQIIACFQDSGSILCVDSKGDLIVHGGTSHVLYLSQFMSTYKDTVAETMSIRTLGSKILQQSLRGSSARESGRSGRFARAQHGFLRD